MHQRHLQRDADMKVIEITPTENSIELTPTENSIIQTVFNTEGLEIITNENLQVLLNANPDIAFDKKYSRVVYTTFRVRNHMNQKLLMCAAKAPTLKKSLVSETKRMMVQYYEPAIPPPSSFWYSSKYSNRSVSQKGHPSLSAQPL